MSAKTVVLDPGHGGHDSGAVGPGGIKEKDVVLDVCLRVQRLLRNSKKVNLILTRSTDVFHSLSKRAAISNASNAFLFLSVHCNSAEKPAEGYETFTSPGQTKADPRATRLIHQYGNEFAELKLRQDISDGDPDKEAKFTVLTATKAPAVLHELEFIHTQKGAQFFNSSSNKDRMAEVIAAWIETETSL